jgi:tRNA-2-methylthio-N6-dimethylallyladenosine synthase
MKLAVTGCMAQGEAKELLRRARHVDVVLGTRCFHRIVEAVERVRAGERHVVVTDLADDPAKVRCEAAERKEEAPLRAFVPIILGCTNFCSYCIVPYVRGAETSRPPAEVLGEVRELVTRGTREVMLLGQNVLAWGRDLPTQPTFEHLLGQVDDIEGLQRVRFITCHPRDVSGALVERMATQGKICEHIHLPMQAGTDKLLREMNRGYTVGQYRAVVDQLRAAVPGIAITTDMIVGFPGETGLRGDSVRRGIHVRVLAAAGNGGGRTAGSGTAEGRSGAAEPVDRGAEQDHGRAESGRGGQRSRSARGGAGRKGRRTAGRKEPDEQAGGVPR